MNKDSKIYVAGHTGMVGSAIVRKLLAEGHTNIITIARCGLDLINQQEVCDFFKDKQPEYVFLAAAKVGGIAANENYPADFIYNNLMIQSNVIHTAHEFGVKKLLFLGSSCIYPRVTEQPINESALLTGALEPTNEPYAIAKIAGIKMCQAYRKQHSSNFICAMPTNLYGPCFSGDTDVLTVDGIKNIKDIKVGDSVYGLNPNTHDVEIEKVTHTQKTKTSEYINFKGRSVNFKVTPDHKIYYKYDKKYFKKHAEFFRNRAGNKYGQITLAHHNPISNLSTNNTFSLTEYVDEHHIIKGSMVKDGKHAKSKFYPIEYNIDDFCEFLGWYISEGSVLKNCKSKGGLNKKNGLILPKGLNCGQIRISQNKLQNIDNYNDIDNLLKRMRLPYGKDNYAFYFNSRLFQNFIRKNIGVGCDNVRIPSFIFNLGFKQRKILFQAMMKGDGHKTMRRYTTTSLNLKNDFIHLCFTLGINNGTVSYDGCYRISLRNIRSNPTIKYKDITVEKKTDTVYCITTEKNHIIYAGRNNQLNWIGQCDNYDLENSHVLPGLMHKIHLAKIHNSPFVEIWGTGKPRREFLHVDDLADACIVLMHLHNKSNIVNIGTGSEISIDQLAFYIKKIIGYEGALKYNTEMPDGTQRKLLDVSYMRDAYKWESKIDLIEGIQRVYFHDFLPKFKTTINNQ